MFLWRNMKPEAFVQALAHLIKPRPASPQRKTPLTPVKPAKK